MRNTVRRWFVTESYRLIRGMEEEVSVNYSCPFPGTMTHALLVLIGKGWEVLYEIDENGESTEVCCNPWFVEPAPVIGIALTR